MQAQASLNMHMVWRASHGSKHQSKHFTQNLKLLMKHSITIICFHSGSGSHKANAMRSAHGLGTTAAALSSSMRTAVVAMALCKGAMSIVDSRHVGSMPAQTSSSMKLVALFFMHMALCNAAEKKAEKLWGAQLYLLCFPGLFQ